MSTPHELDRMIDDQLDGNLQTHDGNESALTTELITLANSFTLDANFDSALARQFKTSIAVQPKTRRRVGWQRMGAAAAIVLFALIAVTLSVPQFRAFAQEIIDDLFPRSEETERTIEYIPFDQDEFEDFDTFDALQDAVEFEIKLPDLGNAYVFEVGMTILSRNTILMRFSPPETEFPDYRVMQQPLVDATSSGIFWFGEEDNLIGPEAEILEVEFGEYIGEFVQGSWVTGDHLTEGAKDYFWRSDFPIYHLRWQDATFLYEIKLVSTDPIQPEDLVAIAESMMDD
ncbi:MAG: hypothetical protein RLP44_06610 [Aggregatilineales bacterium]